MISVVQKYEEPEELRRFTRRSSRPERWALLDARWWRSDVPGSVKASYVVSKREEVAR